MNRYQYTGESLRFRTIVAAWRENDAGEGVDGTHVERVVCVEVDYYPVGTQVARAKEAAQAIMQALYPRVNAWEIYNTVDEKESPEAVLGYVTGWAKGCQCYEANPIVAFRTANNPAEHREATARSWDEVFAEEDAKAAQQAAASDAAQPDLRAS